jgi:hypothetical protein
MAPRVLTHPETRPTETEETVDERILAQHAQHSPTDQELEDSEERRSCFYCLEGWVFLGSIGHDGEEIVEAIRCRRCGGTGWIEG